MFVIFLFVSCATYTDLPQRHFDNYGYYNYPLYQYYEPYPFWDGYYYGRGHQRVPAYSYPTEYYKIRPVEKSKPTHTGPNQQPSNSTRQQDGTRKTEGSERPSNTRRTQ